MFCKYCGETVYPNERVCRRCGREIPTLSENGGTMSFMKRMADAKSASGEVVREIQTKEVVKKYPPLLSAIICGALALVIILQIVCISKINKVYETIMPDMDQAKTELIIDSLSTEEKISGIAVINGKPEIVEIQTKDNGYKFEIVDFDAEGVIYYKVATDSKEIEVDLEVKDKDFGEMKSVAYHWQEISGDKWTSYGTNKKISAKEDAVYRCIISRESKDGGIISIMIENIKL